jgi:hypothetical protein
MVPPNRPVSAKSYAMPVTGKCCNTIVGAREAEGRKIGMQLLQCSLLLARLACFRLQPVGYFVSKGIKFALPL